jgi:hypothetical protein
LNQLAIEFSPRCSVPDADTQAGQILRALQAGEKLTPLEALEKFGCLSLSQRIGGLKRMGWPILTQMVKTRSGKSVAEYRMVSN